MWKSRRGTWTASWYAQPGKWEMRDGLEEPRRPAFVRGDCAWGTATHLGVSYEAAVLVTSMGDDVRASSTIATGGAARHR